MAEQIAIRFPAPSAPGSRSSEEAARVADPMRARSHRLIMIALLQSAGRPLSREELAERTGIKESTLCARLAELRPFWIEALDRACVASSGLHVDGYRLVRRAA